MHNSVASKHGQQSMGFYEKAINFFLNKILLGGLTIKENDKYYFYGDKNHPLQGSIMVNSKDFYREVFWGGGLGLAESYILNKWETDNLTLLLQIMALNLEKIDKIDQSGWGVFFRIASKLGHFFKRNHQQGAKRNIAKHYDLGNSFFETFLDPTMLYSAARFEGQDCSLEQASQNKLRYICESLQLKQSDHLLEIGTGWGGLAVYAASQYGCKVTTTTISKEQFSYAKALVSKLGLRDKISVLLQDYRQLSGEYDKLVSIEMIEAVGHQYFSNYFKVCSQLVKANGLFFLQAITIEEQRYISARDSVDFIKKYIFPGCCIPALGEIMKNIRQYTDYNVFKIEDITFDYANTLRCWRENFVKNLNEIRFQGFDQAFIRKWLYYFSYCEAGFRERKIFDLQMVFSKPDYRVTENVNL